MEEFAAVREAGSFTSHLTEQWQPGMMEDLRRRAAASEEVVRVTMSDAAQRQAAGQQAESPEGFRSFVVGGLAGSFSTNDSYSAMAGQTVIGLTPLGVAADARDIAAAGHEVYEGKPGAWGRLGLAAVAIIPGLDFLKGGARIVRKGVLEVTEGASTRLLHAVPEDVLVSALRESFETQRMQLGSHVFQLDYSGMKHILERHHPAYWNGTVRSTQTFFDSHMSMEEVSGAVRAVMQQNRDELIRIGTNDSGRITSMHNGVEYILSVDEGRVIQFFPKAKE